MLGKNSISVARLEDIPAACKLLSELFAQESEFKSDAAAQSAGLTALISDSEKGHVLVARRDGKIVGMVSLLYIISTALGGRAALLEDMVVSGEIRGQNIGSELISFACIFARQKKCKRITLLTDADNSGAHRFYERHGFIRSSMTTFRQVLD